MKPNHRAGPGSRQRSCGFHEEASGVRNLLTRGLFEGIHSEIYQSRVPSANGRELSCIGDLHGDRPVFLSLISVTCKENPSFCKVRLTLLLV